MQKNNNRILLGSLKIMVAVALLSAVSFVFGRFLAFPQGESATIRFSLENLPILLAGMAFGPIAGGLCGLLSDLIGCFISGYPPNPILSVGAVSVGVISGLVFLLWKKGPVLPRCFVSVYCAHIVGSVLIKTLGLAQMHGMATFFPTLGIRCVNYAIVATVEFLLLYLLFRNKGMVSQLEKMRR